MNWAKTIRIDGQRVLAFDYSKMKIALLISGVEAWSKTFTDSKLFYLVNHRCDLLHVGLYGRYNIDIASNVKMRSQRALLEYSALSCLGFEQIVKPDSYSLSKMLKFEPDEEIETFVELICAFEKSYATLARSIIDKHTKELLQ